MTELMVATVTLAVEVAIDLITRYPNSEKAATVARLVLKVAMRYHGKVPEAVRGAWTRAFLRLPRAVALSPSLTEIQQVVSDFSNEELEAVLRLVTRKSTEADRQALQRLRDRLELSASSAETAIGQAIQDMLQRRWMH